MAILPSFNLRYRIILASFLGAAFLWEGPVLAQAPAVGASAQANQAEDQRPLSPAQIALFETPHLQNVSQAETLDYSFVLNGPTGFTDKVAVHVRAIRPDGTKDLSFDFLTGERRVSYPELDSFHGNPLIMLVLERDVLEMKQTLGLSAAYFRNRIRQSFVDQASLADTEIKYDGQMLPGRTVTVQPFANDDRLQQLPSVQQKSYTFMLADGVPGGIAEMRIEMPGNPAMGLPAYSERVSFQGVDQ